MKIIKIFFLQCAVFLCGVQALSAQEKWIIRNHPLYPFSQYNGDTVKYLRQNFDGGAVDLYMGQPMSKFFQDMDSSLPIRTCFPYYVARPSVRGTTEIHLLGFYGLVYTKEQLKQMIKEGKKIYAISLLFEKWIDDTKEPEVYNYVRNLGLGRILPWTPELQQKIEHLPYGNNPVQELTSEIQRYLENYP